MARARRKRYPKTMEMYCSVLGAFGWKIFFPFFFFIRFVFLINKGKEFCWVRVRGACVRITFVAYHDGKTIDVGLVTLGESVFSSSSASSASLYTHCHRRRPHFRLRNCEFKYFLCFSFAHRPKPAIGSHLPEFEIRSPDATMSWRRNEFERMYENRFSFMHNLIHFKLENFR